MQLYFDSNASGAGIADAWSDPLNWWEDAGATIPHGVTPTSGDDCSLGIGYSGTPTIQYITVDLGVGTCDFAILLNYSSTITGGNFTGNVNMVNGAITGGTFSGTITIDSGSNLGGGTTTGDINLLSGGNISSGTHSGYVDVDAAGTISGGSFSGNINLDGAITGGTFTCSALNNASGTISNGTFNCGTLTNSGFISGGTFALADLVIPSGGIVSGGTFTCVHVHNIWGTISSGTFTISTAFSNGDGSYSAQISGGTIHNLPASTFYNALNASISGGTFDAETFTNEGTISGGTYAPPGTIAYTDLLINGKYPYPYPAATMPSDPGFVSGGGSYAPVISVTGVPSGGDILGAGLL